MQSRFSRKFGMTFAVLGVLALAGGLATFRAQADEWNKKTVITIDQPIQITDTYLEPGTYVLKLANSSSDRHIVYIFNRDENHLINTVMAINNYRLEPTGNSRFTFYETPQGYAKAMRGWFYPGDNFGQEFRYPKQLRQLASLAVIATGPREPVPPPPPPPAVTEREETVAQVAEPEVVPAPEPVAQEQPREEPAVIAQNSPPPAPEAAPAPAETPAPPQELPKTATPYPIIGLGGLLSLGLYGLIRLRRSD
jgi:outer membrane biosynthesis protein TonB